MRRLMSRALVLLLFVTLPTSCHAKKRRNNAAHNAVGGKKRECEAGCSHIHDDDRPNCVLRCQSEACYTEVYLPEELEPGEIDIARQRSFQNCLTREAREMRTNKIRANKQPKPQPAAAEEEPDAAEDATTAEETLEQDNAVEL